MTNYTTRSGRTIKKPKEFKPTEDTFTDDFREDEYDTDESFDTDIDTDEEIDSESEYDEDDCEEDDNGNLKGFVVSDSEDDEEDA
jgi:hypothetical protein